MLKKTFTTFFLPYFSPEKFNAKGFFSASHSLLFFFEKLSKASSIMQSADYRDIFCVFKLIIDFILGNEKNEICYSNSSEKKSHEKFIAVKRDKNSNKILLT